MCTACKIRWRSVSARSVPDRWLAWEGLLWNRSTAGHPTASCNAREVDFVSEQSKRFVDYAKWVKERVSQLVRG